MAVAWAIKLPDHKKITSEKAINYVGAYKSYFKQTFPEGV